MKIKAYLKPQCGWSRGVRAIFDKYGITYDDKDIINNPDIYYDAQLSGDIPESITNWQYIKELRLGRGVFDGMLTGEIDILGNLTTLEKLFSFYHQNQS